MNDWMEAETECRNYANCGEYLAPESDSDFCENCEAERAEMEAESARLETRVAELEHEVRQLLAVINRDGGEKTAEAPDLIAAMQSARTLVAREYLAAIDELEQESFLLDWLETRARRTQSIGQSPKVFWGMYDSTLPIAAMNLREAIRSVIEAEAEMDRETMEIEEAEETEEPK